MQPAKFAMAINALHFEWVWTRVQTPTPPPKLT